MSFRSRGALRVAVAAKAVSFFGDQVATVALVLRLQSEGAGAGAIAALLMADLAPIALLAGPAGRLADRYGSRALLLTSGAAQAVVCAALVGVSGTPATLALVAVLGVGQAVNGATWAGLLPSLVAPAGLSRALGRAQAANTLGLIAAPAVAGLLTAGAGARPAIALDALTFVAVAVAGWRLPDRRSPVTGEPMTAGWRIVAREPLLRTAIAGLGLLIVLGAMVNVVEVFLVRDTLGAGPFWYGAAGAAYAVGVFAGALAAGRLAGDRALVHGLVAGTAGLGLGLAGMGLAPGVAVLVAVSVAAGTANGVVNVCSSALVFGRAAPAERGRVGAVVGGVASAAQLVAYTAGAGLAAVLDPRQVFVLGGALAAAAALPLAPALRRAIATPPPATTAATPAATTVVAAPLA